MKKMTEENKGILIMVVGIILTIIGIIMGVNFVGVS